MCLKLLYLIGFCLKCLKMSLSSRGHQLPLWLPKKLMRPSYLTLQNLCFLVYNSTSYLQERLSGLNNLLSMKVLHPESGTYWGSDMLVSFLPPDSQ